MLRVLYAGSPEASAKVLTHLLNAYDCKSGSPAVALVGVLTNPPSAKGRHKELVHTAVARAAAEAGLPVFTPAHLDAECRASIAALAPDIFVCFAYGHIFGPKFLDAFPLGGVNLHPSLLPRWRGPTPVPSAILAQDAVTGVTVQRVALEMDAGAILAQEKIVLSGNETGESLLAHAADIGAGLLTGLLDEIAANREVPPGVPQDERAATFCGRFTRGDGRIDWRKSAAAINAQVRAYHPWPGAWTVVQGVTVRCTVTSLGGSGARGTSPPPGTIVGTDKTFGILVQTGDGILGLTRLQRAGKKEAPWQDFLNGWPGFLNLRFEGDCDA
jgi:methionyl-tRNA formyltransferase